MNVRVLLIPLALVVNQTFADGTIHSPERRNIKPAFDILDSRVRVDGGELVFSQRLAGNAGKEKPSTVGKLNASQVYSYVWPTSLDSSAVGFEREQGILALAATAHPDFDDTPLYDENHDRDRNNDGATWHSHWVVLVKDEQCGQDGMKVRDIPDGTKPKLPATWPGLAILIDSPGYAPRFEGKSVTVRVPLEDIGAPENFNFDGVTSALQVNANLHAPLLCIKAVFDVASGDLSLTGRLSR